MPTADASSIPETTNSDDCQTMSTTRIVSSIERRLRAALYDEDTFISLNMDILEEKIGVKRENVSEVTHS
ncbi:unnamed protein product [Toxocara canis]|uniref:DEK_C domain-containing protein n=1 Tax=Toxocara canis TaxID=6265 RepID=A0A183VH22_TOXCA|nr:unnamed protein product [Toxocara canis]